MKKIFTMLLTVILLVSQLSAISVFAASVAGTEADPIKLGDSAYYLAAENATTGKGGQIWEFKKPETEKPSSGYGYFIMGGGSTFEFYSQTAQTLKLTVKMAPWARNDKKDILAFLNPDIIPTAYNAAMAAGTDYPERSTAVIDYTFDATGNAEDFSVAYPAYTSTYAYMYYSNPADWTEYEYFVEAAEGKNTLWFPSNTLTYTDESSVKHPMYPTQNNATVACNANTCLYSVKVEALEGGDVVYAKDIPEKYIYGLLDGFASGDEFKTNSFYNLEGIYTAFPFSVGQTEDYVMNVYYSMPGNNTAASVYLDLDMTRTPAQMNTSSYSYGQNYDADTKYADSTSTYVTNLDALNAQYNTTYTKYPNAPTARWWNCYQNWIKANITEDTKRITAQTESWTSTSKLYDGSSAVNRASRFSVISFDLGNVKAGDHIATFLCERIDTDNDGDFGDTDGSTVYNKEMLINRIEVIPKTEDMPMAVTTNVNTSVSGGISPITTLAAAKSASDSINFNAYFLNNNDETKYAMPIVALYDTEGKLITCKFTETKNYAVAPNGTGIPAINIAVTQEELTSDVGKVAMFTWSGTNGMTPLYSATVLE